MRGWCPVCYLGSGYGRARCDTFTGNLAPSLHFYLFFRPISITSGYTESAAEAVRQHRPKKCGTSGSLWGIVNDGTDFRFMWMINKRLKASGAIGTIATASEKRWCLPPPAPPTRGPLPLSFTPPLAPIPSLCAPHTLRTTTGAESDVELIVRWSSKSLPSGRRRT